MKSFESTRKMTAERFAGYLKKITGNAAFAEVDTYQGCVDCLYGSGNLVLPFPAEDLEFIEQRYPVYGALQGQSQFKDVILDAFPNPVMVVDSYLTGDDKLVVAQVLDLERTDTWMRHLYVPYVTARPIKRHSLGQGIFISPVLAFKNTDM